MLTLVLKLLSHSRLAQRALSCLLIAVIFSLLTSHVLAQGTPPTGIDLSITPPTAYLVVKPGQTKTHTFTIENRSSLALQVTPKLVDFMPDGRTGQPLLQDLTTFAYFAFDPQQPGDLANQTIQLDQPFTLKPHHKQSLTAQITLPPAALDKEYHLTLLFTAVPDSSFTIGESQSNLQTTSVIGSNLIVLVSSQNQHLGKLSIDQIHIPQIVESFAPLKYQVLIGNKGAAASAIKGQTRIKNWQNQVIKSWYLYPDLVLAQSSREARGLSQDPAALDSEKIAQLELETFSHKAPFLFGIYSIEVELEQLSEGPQANTAQNFEKVTVTKKVIALPYSLIVLAFLGFILFVLVKVVTQKMRPTSPKVPLVKR
jgi:hypothetical protein